MSVFDKETKELRRISREKEIKKELRKLKYEKKQKIKIWNKRNHLVKQE